MKLIGVFENTLWLNYNKQLLEEAFPIEERPPLDQIENRNKDLFHACVIMHEEQPIGIFNYWTFDDFLYIEHFAIEDRLRNNGYGKSALQLFFKENEGRTIVLEAEMPTTDIAQRRLGFYQRNGFSIQPQTYIQPAYRPGGECVELRLLSTQLLNNEQYMLVTQTIHQKVYGVVS